MKRKHVYRVAGLFIVGSFSALLYITFCARRDFDKPINVLYDARIVNSLKKAVVTNNGINTHVGRSATNGRWYSMLKPYELYTYTAFLDDRPTLGGKRIVRVLAVMEQVKGQKVYCGMWYAQEEENEPPDVILAEMLTIGYGVFRHNKFFKEYILSCELTSKQVQPIGVTIIPSKTSTAFFVMPVERIKHAEKEIDFAVCVSVSYSHHDPYRLVEWLEMQKILGASVVTIYNNSLSEDASLVFQHYAKEGFLDFRQSHSFLPDAGELTIHLHMSPVLNDCMYRNMYRAKKIVVVDLDEVIVPQIHSDWSSMLVSLEENLPKEHFFQYRSYVFKNTYFFLDLPPDQNQPRHSVFLRHRVRTSALSNDVAIKSIIDPKVCVQLHNHACWFRTEPRHMSHEVDVDESYGMNHHYKKCHFDKLKGIHGLCEKLFQSGNSDNTMLRFKEKLLVNMEGHLKELNLKI